MAIATGVHPVTSWMNAQRASRDGEESTTKGDNGARLGQTKAYIERGAETLPCTDEKGDTPVVNDDQDRYGKINPYCLEWLWTPPTIRGHESEETLPAGLFQSNAAQTAPRHRPRKAPWNSIVIGTRQRLFDSSSFEKECL